MADGATDGTGAPQPSVATLIVLRDLGESDGKLVIKAALLELVAVDAWKLKEVRRMLRRPLIAFGRGGEPVPQRTLLALLSSAVERSPSVSRRGETLHELEAVVGHLVKAHITPRSILNACLDDLAAAGLVAESSKTVRIGGTSQRLSIRQRTHEGEALLARGLDLAQPRISSEELDYLLGLRKDRSESAFDEAFDEAAVAFDAPRGGRDADDTPAAGWEQYGSGYRG